MTVGDVVHFPGDIVSLVGGAGGVSKGDVVYLSDTATVLAIDAVDKFDIGMAMEDIAEGKYGPVLLKGGAPVVKQTLVNATAGKPVVYSATGLTDLTETALATGVEVFSIVGIAWDTVTTAAEGRVQLIFALFRDSGQGA